MSLRKLVMLAAAAVMLSLGMAGAAHAADYPATTGVTFAGSTVAGSSTSAPSNPHNDPNGSTVVPAGPARKSSALPFTGGNSLALVWAGVAILATGAFVVSGSRRRAARRR